MNYCEDSKLNSEILRDLSKSIEILEVIFWEAQFQKAKCLYIDHIEFYFSFLFFH